MGIKRKIFYYSGIVFMVLGILICILTFIDSLRSINYIAYSYEQTVPKLAVIAIFGIILIVIGNAFMRVGGKGSNDSEVVDVTTDANATNFGDKLRELHRLHEEGILSEEEYEHKKREILDQI